jgi:tRNA dimethylallyltransferase
MPPARERPAPPPPGAPKLLVLVGPTASGKTRLGIELALRLSGEIVSADSQQVYRDLEIGTAKPTREERERVVHHLVDFADPRESLSAGAWARLADEAIGAIRSRGKLPIVVGGTGLWVRALLLGLVEAPAVDHDLRQRLMERGRREGREALHAELARVDPQTAAAIPAQNLVQVVRALELFEATGERPSTLRARHAFTSLRFDARVLGLSPPREELYRRIDERAKAMFDQGLVDEVRGLVSRGLREAAQTKALGYPQALAVAEERLEVGEAIRLTARDSRHYAKRQLTWFRTDPLVEWLGWPLDLEALVADLARMGFTGESR